MLRPYGMEAPAVRRPLFSVICPLTSDTTVRIRGHPAVGGRRKWLKFNDLAVARNWI